MVKLTRRAGEAVMIGSNVNITILNVNGNQVEIGINTPKEISIYWVENNNEPNQDEMLNQGAGAI